MMTSMKTKAQSALERMVEGAATEVRSSTSRSGEHNQVPKEIGERLQKQIEAKGRSLQNIPIELIRLDENIRRRYDEKSLDGLAGSLRADGLIQFPTICLKECKGRFDLICRNGHRRILAAKRLGWTHIECVVGTFDSEKAELYHTLNANMHDELFYLDVARAYADATAFGENDRDIAARVGVNPRTVGWYRRLVTMSPACEQLVRAYPDLFNATWGVRLARCGELPSADKLYALMQQMVAVGKAWIPKREDSMTQQEPEKKVSTGRVAAKEALQVFLALGNEATNRSWAAEFLEHLRRSGYLQARTLKVVKAEILKEANTEVASS